MEEEEYVELEPDYEQILEDKQCLDEESMWAGSILYRGGEYY